MTSPQQRGEVRTSATGILYISTDALGDKLVRLLDRHHQARRSIVAVKRLPGLELAIETVRQRIQGQRHRLAA